MEQPWLLVQQVMDYRTAIAAKDAFNEADQEKGFDRLRASPQMMQMLLYMTRAQAGKPLEASGGLREDAADALAVADLYREAQDGDSR